LLGSHKFASVLKKHDDISYIFEFVLKEGTQDKNLMNVVFTEYINNPFLVNITQGRSFIGIGECPLIDRTLTTNVDYGDGSKITYTLSSPLFKNQFVSQEEVGKDDKALYVELANDRVLRLKNASTKNLGQVMFLLAVVDILNGLTVSVNIDEYIPRCSNCIFNSENFQYYKGLFGMAIKTEFGSREGCIVESDRYDLEADTVDCVFLIRDTNPDLIDTESILNDLLGISEE